MTEVVFSSSSNSVDKAIDEYHDPSSFSNSSDSSSGGSNSSSGGNTTDEYTSSIPRVPLKVLQEELRSRAKSGSRAGTSAPSSTIQDEVEIVYSCAIGVASKIEEKRLDSLKAWYQILDDLYPRLPMRKEWCYQSRFGVGIYEAYLLGGLRLPLSAFARELLTREVFEGDHPLIVDEFLYCYKPFGINQSLGFYQFTARGKDYRQIKSLVTSDRNWKTKFFFVSGFSARHPVEVGRDSFAPYTGELGNLRPEGVKRPYLSKFYLERVQKARLYIDRTFHSLVSLRRLATWGLGPEPSIEAIAHELTIRRRKEKKAKYRSSKPRVVKPSLPVLPTQQPSVQIHDIDSEPRDPPSMDAPSIAKVLASSQHSRRVPQNLIENKDLAWERFEKVVTDQDVAACYDMSLKEFKYSGVNDLFKAMSKFIAASRQATKMDKTRILLETRIQEVKDECKRWAEVATKAKDDAKEL
ncbi:hypothetical protein SO802_000652 [Lithocarpus litseifolius]|uniref:Uncharacterized protein n=1 Tax=Lithocarpus litseifolius TaxID=425828 RepID=A0AAW2DVK3_9ROSI